MKRSLRSELKTNNKVQLDFFYIQIIGPSLRYSPKESTCNAGNVGLIPWLGIWLVKEMSTTPVFRPGRNPMTGVWQAIIHGVTKIWTTIWQLNKNKNTNNNKNQVSNWY